LTADIHFDNVQVPAENVVGAVGGGLKIALQTLTYGRIGIAASGVGMAQATFDHSVERLTTRQAFGKKIAQFQHWQFKLAERATEIENARNLYMKAALRMDAGEAFPEPEAAMAKWYATSLRVMDASRQNRTSLRLEDLVDCFIRPYFEPGVHGALLARFILQHRLDPSEMTHRVFEQHLNPFAMEFIDALCMTDKRISRVDWLWRYTLLTGTVMLAMTDVGPNNRMSLLSSGQADASQVDELKRHLAEYLCRALRSG